jgi:hypothetical protein
MSRSYDQHVHSLTDQRADVGELLLGRVVGISLDHRAPSSLNRRDDLRLVRLGPPGLVEVVPGDPDYESLGGGRCRGCALGGCGGRFLLGGCRGVCASCGGTRRSFGSFIAATGCDEKGDDGYQRP